jgi:nucleotide-binding universal stress UspA family protein
MERAWLGSVADALVRHIDVPILLVKPSDHEPMSDHPTGGYRNVVIALDGSERAERAIAPALALCAAGAMVTLLRVASPPSAVTSPFLPHAARFTQAQLESRRDEAEEYVTGQRRALGEVDCSVETAVVLDYHPARAILRYAGERSADLVALGTHGRGPISRTVLGSVSDKVVRAAAVPVLVS